jgi:two-component system phosphate regulon sensor histidine kinase PhoR
MIYDTLSSEAAHSELAPLLDAEGHERNVVVELTRGETAGDCVLRVARHPLRAGSGAAGGSGAISGHIWSIRDVTQQKLAERMHNEFVNSATHELRTPMANIKAYAETLAGADELNLEEQKEFCNTINSEVSRLSRLIDDLLSIESMEVGSLALARQETDVERLLREKVEMVRPLMEKKKLAFHVSLPEKLPKMCIDKDKVALAIDNLLGNAAKYTPAGGEVSLRVDVDEQTLHVHVQDTGVGIAPEEVSKVFEKFFRSEDPRIRDETGTGLGLAMVREIVHLHGGEIEVQSRLNEGSTFGFTLPMG